MYTDYFVIGFAVFVLIVFIAYIIDNTQTYGIEYILFILGGLILLFGVIPVIGYLIKTYLL